MHISAPVPRLPEPLADLQFLIDGLLAKDPKDRFESADALIAAVNAHEAGRAGRLVESA